MSLRYDVIFAGAGPAGTAAAALTCQARVPVAQVNAHQVSQIV